MRFSQSALFQLFFASFLAGLMLSLFYDILSCAHIWLMPSQTRYTVPAIQRMRNPRIKKGSAKKAKALRVVVFFDDVLFCVISAITLVLLLYWMNNGAFRAAAPFLMAAGFFLWHVSVSKGIQIAMQWITFWVETVIYTLCIPIKRLFSWIADKCKMKAQAKHQKRCAQKRETYTRQQFQSIDTTAKKLLSIYVKNKEKKGDDYAKHRKKAV